jgi:hypothetical protein
MRDIFEPKSFLKLLIEVILIGLGVFLALLADQWRENHQHRENAREILRYFREEIAANQKAMQSERAYHEKLLQDVESFEISNAPKTLPSFITSVHFSGLHPIVFEQTARDLALTNQSLSYLSPQLAYAISRVYTRQQALQVLQNSFLQSAFTPNAFAGQDATGLVTAMKSYLIDVNIQEPDLVRLYGELLPQIDAAASHEVRSRP